MGIGPKNAAKFSKLLDRAKKVKQNICSQATCENGKFSQFG